MVFGIFGHQFIIEIIFFFGLCNIVFFWISLYITSYVSGLTSLHPSLGYTIKIGGLQDSVLDIPIIWKIIFISVILTITCILTFTCNSGPDFSLARIPISSYCSFLYRYPVASSTQQRVWNRIHNISFLLSHISHFS